MRNIATPLQKEADRLLGQLMYVHCEPHRKWTYEECLKIAPLTLEIEELKKEKEAVILAHSYVVPEIVYGVADYKSDSYALALEAKKVKAKFIVFAGVRFMAETAKIIHPESQVVIPDILSGCSLADSLSRDELKLLKEKHPDAAVVCYINSTAEVKAESDVVVTSSNVYQIITRLPHKKILFVPDRLMAENIKIDLMEKGIDKEIISSQGTCEVHDQFEGQWIKQERLRYPDLQVVSHPECKTEITSQSDFVGSTGKMMEYVKKTNSHYFMLLTECGLVSRLEVEQPEKHFISSCKLCPYMKLNTLEKIRDVLKKPKSEQIIEVSPMIRNKALVAINRMFELAA